MSSTWHFEVRTTWVGDEIAEPWTITVVAPSLSEACEVASRAELNSWKSIYLEEDE